MQDVKLTACEALGELYTSHARVPSEKWYMHLGSAHRTPTAVPPNCHNCVVKHEPNTELIVKFLSKPPLTPRPPVQTHMQSADNPSAVLCTGHTAEQ